jgi:integrase
MAHISRRQRNGKVRYLARYTDPSGREPAKSFTRKKDAERFLTGIENDKLRGTWTDPVLGRVQLVDWYALWRQATVELRPNTEAWDERGFRLHILPLRVVLLGAYGGLRIGEMAGLRRSRVDLDHGMVEVVEIVTEVSGYLPPKTRAGYRRIEPPRVVVEALADQLARPGSADDLVFVGPQGGPLRLATFRHRIWRPATRVVGLDGLRIHDLRHTAEALWIAAGANPKEVAARAGHTSVTSTLDRYGLLYPDADQALRDRLDALHALSRHAGPHALTTRDGPGGQLPLGRYISTAAAQAGTCGFGWWAW